MKLQDQVPSFELSKRLKELGVKQESLFYYQKESGPNGWGLVFHTSIYFLPPSEPQEVYGLVSAFTVAELGEMLPDLYSTHKKNGGWIMHNNLINDRKEADARAKMLIYLLENNYLRQPQKQSEKKSASERLYELYKQRSRLLVESTEIFGFEDVIDILGQYLDEQQAKEV